MGNVKTVDFSEPIAASDLKVGRCRQLHLNLFITQFDIIRFGYNTDQCWTPNGHF